jgi:hypothetical protein
MNTRAGGTGNWNSTYPLVVANHTHAPTVGVAERAADLILGTG